MEDQEDNDAILLSDTLEAFNLTQHIKFPMHNLGHTLLLTATEYNPRQQITSIPGIYVSGYRIVCIQPSGNKPKHNKQEVKFRKVTEEAINKFIDQFNNQLVLEATTLEDAIFHLNDQMLRTLDEVATIKTKLKPNTTRSNGMTQTCMVREE